MADANQVEISFQLVADNFEHAWFFNRFRVERFGNSVLATLALVHEVGGIFTVNSFVVTENDLQHNRARCLNFLATVAPEQLDPERYALPISAPPTRVYPVNHINLSRVDQSGELGLFRYSFHTLVEHINKSKEGRTGSGTNVPCYPVVVFRTDLAILTALIASLFSP